jgi:hypothetical protein
MQVKSRARRIRFYQKNYYDPNWNKKQNRKNRDK